MNDRASASVISDIWKRHEAEHQAEFTEGIPPDPDGILRRWVERETAALAEIKALVESTRLPQASSLTKQVAERVYSMLVAILGAPVASAEHFVEKWLKFHPDLFGYSLGESPFTFMATEGKWFVTSFRSGCEDILNEVNQELTSLQFGSKEKAA